MVLNGTVNTRAGAPLVNGGSTRSACPAWTWPRCRCAPLAVNGRSLGRVGAVQTVNGEAVLQLLDLGPGPVISPVSLGEDGLVYNVNADHVATGRREGGRGRPAGVREQRPRRAGDGQDDARTTLQQIEGLIADGHITGGMIPKVRSATEAVLSGVYQP